MNKEEKQPAYDCKYIGYGENCLLHSCHLPPFGHVTFACVKKCKDYEKKEEDDDISDFKQAIEDEKEDI